MYDDMGQLVLEEVYPVGADAYTMVYEYDTYGNIRSEKKYDSVDFSSVDQAHEFGTLKSTVPYYYADASGTSADGTSWRDQLQSRGGRMMSYDSIGNHDPILNRPKSILPVEDTENISNEYMEYKRLEKESSE